MPSLIASPRTAPLLTHLQLYPSSPFSLIRPHSPPFPPIRPPLRFTTVLFLVVMDSASGMLHIIDGSCTATGQFALWKPGVNTNTNTNPSEETRLGVFVTTATYLVLEVRVNKYGIRGCVRVVLHVYSEMIIHTLQKAIRRRRAHMEHPEMHETWPTGILLTEI